MNQKLQTAGVIGLPLAILGAFYGILGAPFYTVDVNGRYTFAPVRDELVEYGFKDPQGVSSVPEKEEGAWTKIPLKGPLPAIYTPTAELTALYKHARNKQHSPRLNFVRHGQIKPIADKLQEGTQGNQLKYIQRVLRFVDNNVTYAKDTTEYYEPTLFGKPNPRPTDFTKFPLQTLYDTKGDCDEYAVLVASFLASGGIETGLAYSEKHAATGFAVEDVEGIDRIVIEAVSKALGNKLISVTAKVDRNKISVIQARKETKMAELEKILAKAPVVVGKRFSYDIEVPNQKRKEWPATAPCNQLYWAGDFDLTFSEVSQPSPTDFVATTADINSIEDVLFDASLRKKADPALPRILYKLPQLEGYIVATPSLKLNNGSSCKSTLRTFSFVPISEVRSPTQFKRKKIFYLEPQKRGFALHSEIPATVVWEPLPQEAYPLKQE